MIRPPAVAGSFYPSDPTELARQIDAFTLPLPPSQSAAGCIVPHAGYMYSGHVAGAVYSAVNIPARTILLGPRHFPRGEPLAIFQEGAWQTPLGDAAIDASLADAVAHEFPRLRDDPVAHQREHSLEVQIPFLQRIAGDFRFVPIVLATDRFPILEELGHAVARAVRAQPDPVLIVASTDMNHYESDAVTRLKDQRAIAKILALDPRGLFDTVRNEGISMCGYAATVAALVAWKDLGAADATLVRYATSGEINGDFGRVVGYAGCVIR
ncbi:MAG TPA: AmmeMemoRadiSam system protein B [Verrucomicrobiae bacterium]|nr:AmmeMemoRadiSam system protein B [Verrucomicrobiae bacterium]